MTDGKFFQLFDRRVCAVLLQKAHDRVQQNNKQQNCGIRKLIFIFGDEREHGGKKGGAN